METEEDIRRYAEKRANFRGSAKIGLKHLSFDQATESDLDDAAEPVPASFLDPKNVARLIRVFELEGCLRSDAKHNVPVIIPEEQLQDGLRRNAKTNGDLLQPRAHRLDFPSQIRLRCLHGKHRIAAAEDFLMPGDKWWTVDLYSADLSGKIRRDLRDEYANSKNFCQGDIFQYLRACQKEGDREGEGRWLARLSDSMRTDVRQFQKRTDMRPLNKALDNLLPYIGFWPAMELGNLHRILNMKCPEELQNALVNISTCWDSFIDGDHRYRPLIDFRTVQLLQMRIPGASEADRAFIEKSMADGTLFPMITNRSMRSRMLGKILQTPHMIPSLFWFWKNTLWLEPCAKIMRHLVGTGRKESTRQALCKSYTGRGQEPGMVRVLKGDLSFGYHRGTESQAVECGYRQLWLFAWRHFPELSGISPRKDAGKPKPRVKAQNEQCWRRLARLAWDLGFESEAIHTLRNRDSDVMMAMDFIRQARPAAFYDVPGEACHRLAEEICKTLDSIEERSGDSILSEVANPDVDVPMDYRCGRAHESSLDRSKRHFYIEEVYVRQDPTVSHFAANRDIFLSFLGSDAPLQTPEEASQRVPERPRGDIPNPAPSVQNDIVMGSGTDEDDSSRQEHQGMVGPTTGQVQIRDNPAPSVQNDIVMGSGTDEDESSRQEHQGVVGPTTGQVQIRDNTEISRTHGYDIPPNEGSTVDLPGDPSAEGSLLLTQTVDEAQADALLDAELEPSNEAIPEVHPGSLHLVPFDPDKRQLDSHLYEEWTKRCKIGDIFFVTVSDASWDHFDNQDPARFQNLKTFLAPRTQTCYFAGYSVGVKRMICVDPAFIHTSPRDHEHDGVVYIFQQASTGQETALQALSFETLRGECTRSRLHHVEYDYNVKRQRGDTDGRGGSLSSSEY